jgi:hypothetical protein
MKAGWLRTIASFYEHNRPEMIICPVILEVSGGGFFRRFQEIEFLVCRVLRQVRQKPRSTDV